MPNHTRTAALVAACAAIGVAGCGSSSGGDLSTPSKAVKSYTDGIAKGNGKQACDALSSTEQQAALSSARSSGVKASDCVSLFNQVKAHLTSAQLKQFADAKVTNVKQSGSTATATVSGAQTRPTLVKSGGKWQITGGVGF